MKNDDEQGYVYFLPLFFPTAKGDESEDMGFMKIGYSTNPEQRRYTLQTTLPFNLLHFEAVFPGTEEDEKEVHKRLAKHRVRREWFLGCPEVDEFIADLTDAEFLLQSQHGEDYEPTIRECMDFENPHERFVETFTALTDKAKEMGVWPFEPEAPATP